MSYDVVRSVNTA